MMFDYSQQLYNGEASQAPAEGDHLMTIDIKNAMFGLNTGLLFAYGIAIYNWYPGWVEGSDTLFVDRVEGTCQYDDEWGRSTNEIRAWTSAAQWHIGVYGLGFFAWVWNTLAGENGGYKHQVFFRTQQLMALAPIYSMVRALAVVKSYAPTYSRQADDQASYAAC